MPANLHKSEAEWKQDIALSVTMYNTWFMDFAPASFRSFRAQAKEDVEIALRVTDNLTHIHHSLLQLNPGILSALRMSTCPQLAVDRLIGLAGVAPRLVKTMELTKQMPSRMSVVNVETQLSQIAAVIRKLVDPDIFPWLITGETPTAAQIDRATDIVADRLCASVSGPDVRNAQEERQLALIKSWLDKRGYRQLSLRGNIDCDRMEPGTYVFHLNVLGTLEDGIQQVNIPVDAVIMPLSSPPGTRPLFFEAKSAGDFANTNKRRKEETAKMAQLRKAYEEAAKVAQSSEAYEEATKMVQLSEAYEEAEKVAQLSELYHHDVRFNLFLCGYFGKAYLKYEAAAGIDWVWEHRIDDLELFGL